MSRAEFDAVMQRNLIPTKITEFNRPDWAKNIPDAKIHAFAASGSADTPKSLQNVPNQVGGFDMFRNAEPIDGVAFNRDHYYVISDPNDSEQLWVLGPYKGDPNHPDELHHTDDLPPRIQIACTEAP